MKLNICTTFDSKANAYTVPALIPATQSIERSWIEVCNNPDSQFFQHASDYTLFHIGEFDFTTGQITVYEAKKSIGLALDFKRV